MIKYFHDLIQGSEEWIAARLGLLTASEMKYIITPAKLQYSTGEKEKAHLYELMAQRLTNYVEPHYISDDMIRGQDDESYARETYHEKYAQVETVGFLTNDKWGFVLGYSPDGLVGDDGLIECKSRRQKYQVETILDGEMSNDYLIQIQAGMLISERKWCDFISYHGGLPMLTLRIHADEKVQTAIVSAANTFHERLKVCLKTYAEKLTSPDLRLIPTERRVEKEMHI